jgi:hypothetical protein
VIEQVQANFTWAKEYLTWENRMGHPNATALGIFDPPMTAKYSGHTTVYTGCLSLIGFSGVVLFYFFVKRLNHPTEHRAAVLATRARARSTSLREKLAERMHRGKKLTPTALAAGGLELEAETETSATATGREAPAIAPSMRGAPGKLPSSSSSSSAAAAAAAAAAVAPAVPRHMPPRALQLAPAGRWNHQGKAPERLEPGVQSQSVAQVRFGGPPGGSGGEERMTTRMQILTDADA